jgi:hypothetical protein
MSKHKSHLTNPKLLFHTLCMFSSFAYNYQSAIGISFFLSQSYLIKQPAAPTVRGLNCHGIVQTVCYATIFFFKLSAANMIRFHGYYLHLRLSYETYWELLSFANAIILSLAQSDHISGFPCNKEK